MTKYSDQPAPPFMILVVQEFLELLYWKLQSVLDQEGVTMLQWAFMQRANYQKEGVSFSRIIEATGESKDNVRRAAASLRNFADVVVDPKDRRSRRLVLNRRGKRRTGFVLQRFERVLLDTLDARDRGSQRAEQFKEILWDASAYLAPGDLASDETVAKSEQNRQQISDDSLRYVEDTDQDSFWTKEEPPDDWVPF